MPNQRSPDFQNQKQLFYWINRNSYIHLQTLMYNLFKYMHFNN